MDQGRNDQIRYVTSRRPFFAWDLREVLRYRDLVLLYAKKNIVVSYKQTVLGPVWLFAAPFLSGLLQMFIFGYLAGFQTGGVPRIVFYLFSNTAWSVYDLTVSGDSRIFSQHARLFGKVYFPRMAISYAGMLSMFWMIGPQLLMSFLFMAVFVLRGEMSLCALFPLTLLPLLQLALLGQGIGLMYASVTVRYRDLNKLYPVITRALHYLSPVVYPLSQIPGARLRVLGLINPLSAPLELVRALMWGAPLPPAWSIACSAAVALCVNYLGILVFNRTEGTFIDTI